MNQPTREEFEEFKQEIRQEVLRLREQRTEEIKAVRVEVASEDVLNQLKALKQGQQELARKQDEYFESISKRQDEYDKGLMMHSRSISALQENINEIKEIMATKEDLKAMATKEDLKAMATKEDLKAMATKEDLTAMEERLVDTMRKYLQPGGNGH